jgi:uncharacterized SAM-binding protein YcdF (DUF218 family)
VAQTNSNPARRRRRRVVCLTASATIVLWALWRGGSALVVHRPAAPPDAILSLASHEWERLPATAVLAEQYPASLVLLTVPHEISDTNCHRCGERTQWLIELGLAAERIRTLPDATRGTYGEAMAMRRYAEAHGVRRVAIVTSPYHTRRALATFRKVFDGLAVELGTYPASSDSPARPTTWWAHAYDRAYVAYEWAAALYYRVEYGVPLTAADMEARRRSGRTRDSGQLSLT